jgi:hypothetical protein
MLKLYRLAGISASEQTVRQMVERLAKLKPQMAYPMHANAFNQ